MTNLYPCLLQKDTLFKELNSENVYNFYKALKTIPCPMAQTHIRQERKCPPPHPPVWGHGKLMAFILDFYLHDKIRGSPECLILE